MRRTTSIVPALLQNANLDNHNHHNNKFNPSISSAAPSTKNRRKPLQTRDQNVMMRVPPKLPLQTNCGNGTTMPFAPDKQSTGNNTTRPLLPALSAAGVKTSNRTPVTPRVAATVPLASTTPTPSSRSRTDRTPGGARERDEVSTPVSTFLSHNITPRSGSRRSRVDSTNTTPTGTDTPTRGVGSPLPSSIDTFRNAQDSFLTPGLGISGVDKDVPKRQTVSFSPAVSEIGTLKASSLQNLEDSKFFFASDVKSAPTPRPPPPSKNPSFFYANGGAIAAPSQNSNGSALGTRVADAHAKFFHANGTPDVQSSPSQYPPSPQPSSTVSSSSRVTSPRFQNASPRALSLAQRPPSPSKLGQHASIPSPRVQPQHSSLALARPPAIGRGQSTSTITSAKRMSIESQRVISHGRSASVDSSDSSGPPVRKVSGGSMSDATSLSSPLSLVGKYVPVSTNDETSEPGTIDPAGIPRSESPTKAGHSLEHMNELAANARRERKVLDLEITNSSLAAINRTLEREMRKQTAELRRYRRLSRSGRLSIATTMSTRTSTGTISTLDGADGNELSDLSEEEVSEEDGDSDFSEESLDDGTLSPGAIAESDLRHRKKDEKRLQLDLSKHQQLLIDSQKMNQSLKRCLGWTEDLINEGRKALAYSVRVSDVELGGRVLALDEVEDQNEGLSDIALHFMSEARSVPSDEFGGWQNTAQYRGGGMLGNDAAEIADRMPPLHMDSDATAPVPVKTHPSS